LFGGDDSFAPAVVTGMETRALDESPIFDAVAKEKINRGIALKLFPLLDNATAGEARGLGRIGRAAREAAKILAEKVHERCKRNIDWPRTRSFDRLHHAAGDIAVRASGGGAAAGKRNLPTGRRRR
jgi:hypothetical protein